MICGGCARRNGLCTRHQWLAFEDCDAIGAMIGLTVSFNPPGIDDIAS